MRDERDAQVKVQFIFLQLGVVGYKHVRLSDEGLAAFRANHVTCNVLAPGKAYLHALNAATIALTVGGPIDPWYWGSQGMLVDAPTLTTLQGFTVAASSNSEDIKEVTFILHGKGLALTKEEREELENRF